MSSYGRAGAVWDIWPRDCREQLAAYLRAHAAEFVAEGMNLDPEKILHPIHDQVRCCPFDSTHSGSSSLRLGSTFPSSIVLSSAGPYCMKYNLCNT